MLAKQQNQLKHLSMKSRHNSNTYNPPPPKHTDKSKTLQWAITASAALPLFLQHLAEAGCPLHQQGAEHTGPQIHGWNSFLRTARIQLKQDSPHVKINTENAGKELKAIKMHCDMNQRHVKFGHLGPNLCPCEQLSERKTQESGRQSGPLQLAHYGFWGYNP